MSWAASRVALLIHRSHGVSKAQEPLSAFAAYQRNQPEPLNHEEAWRQLLPNVADLPDALMFWVLSALALRSPGRILLNDLEILQRTVFLLHRNWPNRPDLPYQLLLCDPTGTLLQTAPKKWLSPGQCYSRPEASLVPAPGGLGSGSFSSYVAGCAARAA